MRATNPTHLTFLNFILLIIFGEEYAFLFLIVYDFFQHLFRTLFANSVRIRF